VGIWRNVGNLAFGPPLYDNSSSRGRSSGGNLSRNRNGLGFAREHTLLLTPTAFLAGFATRTGGKASAILLELYTTFALRKTKQQTPKK